MTSPVAYTIALIPVFVERNMGARCSTARKREKLRCWCGSQVSPYQESFVRLTRRSGRLEPARLAHELGQDRSRSRRRRRSRGRAPATRGAAGPACPRPSWKLCGRRPASAGEEGGPRHRLAERHQLHLAVERPDRPAGFAQHRHVEPAIAGGGPSGLAGPPRPRSRRAAARVARRRSTRKR